MSIERVYSTFFLKLKNKKTVGTKNKSYNESDRYCTSYWNEQYLEFKNACKFSTNIKGFYQKLLSSLRDINHGMSNKISSMIFVNYEKLLASKNY